MEFVISDGWLRVTNDDVEVARCRIVENDGLVCVGALTVDSSAPYGTFLRVCREVMRHAGERGVRIVVDYGPQMERLVKVYARFGGTCRGIVMENR